MGENTKIDERQSTAYRLREQIRHTESDITETVHALEQRLSPRDLRQRGARKAKRIAWQGTARLLDLAQRTSVQASLLVGGALLMLMRKINARKEKPAEKPAVSGMALAASAAKAFLSGARASEKSGTSRPGRKVAWRGLATAIGAALGSYWYSHKERRV